MLEQLRKLNPEDNVLLADLDIDDYLDPQKTISRYTMGVNMDFMVARLGGSMVIQETETYHGAIEEEEDEYGYFDSLMDNNINSD